MQDTSASLGLLIPVGSVLEVEAQRGGGGRGGGGRSARSSSNVNRGGSARFGSTNRSPIGVSGRPSGDGYGVVEPPVGAEVRTLPNDAVAHDDEGEVTLYQFDRSYFSRSTNDAGQTVYVVEPQPPEEEIDSIPTGSPSFQADGERYYYVNSNLYVAYNENGATGYVNGEPEIGAQVDKLPRGATEIEHDGVTYHQFDMVFFEHVEDENGKPFYEVVDAPGNDEVTELG